MARKVHKSPGEEVFSLFAALTPEEKRGFLTRLGPSLSYDEALALYSSINDTRTQEKDRALLSSGLCQWYVEMVRGIDEYYRNRKSDQDTARRNVEICEKRIQDRKYYSLKRLAGEYDVTPRYISMILTAMGCTIPRTKKDRN